jgi:hypothetical protein
MPTPRFQPGDRVFSHYVMSWGTVLQATRTDEPCPHGVTGDMLPGTTWYDVKMDNGDRERLDDADGNWDLARLLPPSVARRYGYPSDPASADYPSDLAHHNH